MVLIWGMVLCAVCGIIRTFMPTYEWFLVMEFLDAAFGAGTYICGFVLGGYNVYCFRITIICSL